MRKEYAIDQVQLCWVFSAFLIGYALFQVPAGWLAARYGPRIVLTGALLWWGVFTAATALIHPEGSAALLLRSEEHTSELPSLMRISYAVFCLNKKKDSYMRHQQRSVRY